MVDEDKIESKSVRVEPTSQITKGDIPTTVADYATVMTDYDTQMCTFTFYQKHPNAKKENGALTITSIEEEATLEVKMPISTAFALALYMNILLKEMQIKPVERSRIDFGPTSIKQFSKPEEDKKP
jgi:hypothetical protein